VLAVLFLSGIWDDGGVDLTLGCEACFSLLSCLSGFDIVVDFAELLAILLSLVVVGDRVEVLDADLIEETMR